ncbi:MAG: SUMF1/EgtB/PvdO family nonheme iron enzyme [Spirochaetales bacterium]
MNRVHYGIGILLCLFLFRCAGTPTPPPAPTLPPQKEEVPSTVESLSLPKDPGIPPSKEKPPESEEKEAKFIEEKVEKEEALEPDLKIMGLFDGFQFSVAQPTLYWTTSPNPLAVEVELAADPSFSEILFKEIIEEQQVQLPPLEEGKQYYLRMQFALEVSGLSKEQIAKSQKQWKISYRPFSVSLLPVLQAGEIASFTMGYNGGMERERPEHEVTLSRPYQLGTYEITNQEFAYVMNLLLAANILFWEEDTLKGPGGVILAGGKELRFGFQFGFSRSEDRITVLRGREQHPVVGVSWYGALAFCYYLSLMEGVFPSITFDPAQPLETLQIDVNAGGYRLPTEAEWEYAARGTQKLLYPGGALQPAGVNYHRSGDPFEGLRSPIERGGPTTPVGFYDGTVKAGYRTLRSVGPFGHFDLLGNVWEWCLDWFEEKVYRSNHRQDPLGPEEGTQKSVRGGAWNTFREDMRLSMRGFFPPEGTSFSIGFRLARTIQETQIGKTKQ